tara:strand:+ start:110 stop:352 length:243 start_codon:yes stop_codon:yes gene_type:complete
MTFTQRMKILGAIHSHISREAKTVKHDRNMIIELACTYADELPEHEIEFDSISGDSKFEFYQDLAVALIDAAEAEVMEVV